MKTTETHDTETTGSDQQIEGCQLAATRTEEGVEATPQKLPQPEVLQPAPEEWDHLRDFFGDYRKPDWTDDDIRVLSVADSAFRGLHHVHSYKRVDRRPPGEWKVVVWRGLATADWDQLTRLVLFAHERAVRVEIAPHGPFLLALHMSARIRKPGHGMEHHPTIEEAVANIRRGRKS